MGYEQVAKRIADIRLTKNKIRNGDWANMREKVMKLVVTFHTTSDAMAMEKICKERSVPGRLIPVPRAISAGCGLSWCAELTDREQILDVMKEVGIEQEDVHECLV